MNVVLSHLLLLFNCIAVIVTLPIPGKIKLFVASESKPIHANNSHLLLLGQLPFGKRLPTASEEQREDLKVKPIPVMGRSFGRSMQGGNEYLGITGGNGKPPAVTSALTAETTEAYTGPALEKERHDLQLEQFAELMEANMSEPIEIDRIAPEQSIFAHVRWYEEYFEDTKIQLKGDELNPFEYDLFGSCLPKQTDLSSLVEFDSSDDIVDFYAVLMKDDCHGDVVKIYKRLTNLGYLTIGVSGPLKYFSIVPGSPLLLTETLTTDELRSLLRLLKISAYSEVISSLILNPVAAFDPKFRVLSYRAFILINTVLHILDLILVRAAHLYTEVVRSLYKKLLVMGREVFCRYSHPPDDIAQKQRRKNDAIATTILMEYLSKCAIHPEECIQEDAHVGYRKLYLDENLQLFAKYKPKIEALHHKPSFKHVCTLIFPLLD